MLSKILFLFIYSLGGALITTFFIECLVKPYVRRESKSNLGKDNKHLSEVRWLVFFSGFLEVILYGGSFLIGKPEFIILWIGVKTALKWDRKPVRELDINDTDRRGMYHSFLLGTALNIVLGYLAACFVSGYFLTFCK
jgi:hypothetical protein